MRAWVGHGEARAVAEGRLGLNPVGACRKEASVPVPSAPKMGNCAITPEVTSPVVWPTQPLLGRHHHREQ